MQSLSWDFILNNYNINENNNKFIDMYTKIINDFAKLKFRTNQLDYEGQPVMTESLIKHCKVKNNAYKLAISKKI